MYLCAYLIFNHQIMVNWLSFAAVFIGSGLGGVCRYVVSRGMCAAGIATASGTFPWPTFIVNITGCFLIGLFSAWIGKSAVFPDSVRLFLTIGFCGGFTTFSTFISENYRLLSAGDFAVSLLYLAISIVVGFVAYWLGEMIAR